MIYSYRCPDGHVTDLDRPVDQAAQTAFCARCGRPARRLHRLGGIGLGPGTHNGDHPAAGYPRRR